MAKSYYLSNKMIYLSILILFNPLFGNAQKQLNEESYLDNTRQHIDNNQQNKYLKSNYKEEQTIRHHRLLTINNNLTNYILNGNFQQNVCTPSQTICVYYIASYQPQYVAYWIPQPDLQISRGTFYGLPNNNPAVDLASNIPSCIKQQVNSLPAGFYLLTYTYYARSNLAYSYSYFDIYLNGTLIQNSRTTAYGLITQTVTLQNIDDSTNMTLKFCQTPHDPNQIWGAIITDVKLNLLQAYNKVNYLKNGNFQFNTCLPALTYCTYITSNYPSQNVAYWLPQPDIEILKGTFYGLPTPNPIIQLASSRPSCIKQYISSLSAGLYNLTFTYYVRPNLTLNYCNFSIYMNDKQIKRIQATQYGLIRQTIQIFIQYNYTDITIKFCQNSQNPNQGHGAILTQIGFYLVNYYQEEQNKKQIQILNLFQTILDSQILKILNQVPASRRFFRQIFSFFLNIDHLWLYIYHKRDYSNSVKQILTSIKNLQDQKWSFIQNQLLQDNLNMNIDFVQQQINRKIPYTSPYFFEIEYRSSSFLVNSLDYFVLNIPLVIGLFLIGKILFYLLRNFKVSGIFKKFILNGYLILMLTQGNNQSFSYYFTSDCKKLFQAKWSQKLFNLVTLWLYFMLVTILISLYFIFKADYKKNAKLLYDNCENNLNGIVYLLIQNGIFNFLLGTIHLISQDTPQMQLLILFAIQGSFMSYLILKLKMNNKLFQFKYITWSSAISSFLRILLIFTYTIYDKEQTHAQRVIEKCQQVILIIYISLWIVNIIVSYLILLKQAAFYFIQRGKNKVKIDKTINNKTLTNNQILVKSKKNLKSSIIIQNIPKKQNIPYKRRLNQLQILPHTKMSSKFKTQLRRQIQQTLSISKSKKQSKFIRNHYQMQQKQQFIKSHPKQEIINRTYNVSQGNNLVTLLKNKNINKNKQST